MHRDRAIPAPQRPYPSRQSAKPHQRPGPPNLARQCHGRIGAAKLPSIRKQKAYFAQQLFPRHSQQRPNAQILQRRHRQSAALQNWCQPARNSRAKRALRVKEQPPSRVPPFPVREFRCQRDHGCVRQTFLSVSLLSLRLSALRSLSAVCGPALCSLCCLLSAAGCLLPQQGHYFPSQLPDSL